MRKEQVVGAAGLCSGAGRFGSDGEQAHTHLGAIRRRYAFDRLDIRDSGPQICHLQHFLRSGQERTLLPSLPSLRKRIRDALSDEHTLVFIRHHARQRMRERRVSRVDVQSILKRGSVIEDQSEGGVMRVLLEGRDLDGRRVRLVVEMRDDEQRLDVVTVIAD